MNNLMDAESDKKALPKRVKRVIAAISILIPLVVAALLMLPPVTDLSPDAEQFFRSLPPFYATLNGITALLLVVALVAIKRKNIKLHKTLMTTCLLLSLLFLICYIAYHFTIPSTKFGGEGTVKTVYLLLLLTHILLSVVTVPLVLVSYVLGFASLYKRHKRLARITFPIWLYVAITGVLVYLMISPYYAM